MTVFDFNEKYPRPAVLCLGRFESLHKGHMEIINSAKKIAQKNSPDVLVMTFDEGDNPRFNGLILDFGERTDKLYGIADGVMRVVFNEEFSSTDAEEFLTALKNTIPLCGVACGFDFRFGYQRQGDIATLEKFCKKNGIELSVTEKIEADGEKISSTRIRSAITLGFIEKANAMLGYNYFVIGKVEEGRKQGRKLGYPTANVALPSNKCKPKSGVYLTKTVIDGKLYDGITNVGSAPTFNEEKELIETHLKGFDGNLYGKEICVEFVKRIRDIKKFSSIEELKTQLEKDLRCL